MGGPKARRCDLGSLRVSRSKQLQRFRRKGMSWSVFLGLILFALGLISIFTGHVESDFEWYSQRLINRALLSRSVLFQSSSSLSLSLSMRSEMLCVLVLD